MPANNEPTQKAPIDSLIDRTLAYFDKGRKLTIAQKTAAIAVKSAIDTELNTYYSYIEKLSLAPITNNKSTLFTHPKKEQPTTPTHHFKKAHAF